MVSLNLCTFLSEEKWQEESRHRGIQPPGHRLVLVCGLLGGEQWAGEQSFICICSHSPVLASPPKLYLRLFGIRFS